MRQAIKLTFGSVWGWLGIIVGAISLINLGVVYFEVGIGPVLERVVATYKAIVHQGFDYLFFWIDWKMPPWLKDATALWVVFGLANVRADVVLVADGTFNKQSIAEYIYRFTHWPRDLWDILKPQTEWGAKVNFVTFINFVVVPLAAVLAVILEAGI